MMENKEKWEVKYESYINGRLEKEKNALKEKYTNKEIDIKQYQKDEKRFEKIKSNLPKVANLVKLKDELNDLKAEIENEFVKRYNDKKQNQQDEKIEKLIEKSDKENEELLIKIEDAKNKLKDKNLSDDDRKNIQNQLAKDESKLKVNNEKFLELNAKLRDPNKVTVKSELADMSDQDLKKNYQKICMKISRTNFYASRLLKGHDIEAIKVSDQAINWKDRKYNLDIKKLVAKGENAKKLKDIKETAKEENAKKLKKETTKEQEEQQEGKKSEKEKDKLIEVSEFDKKHPRLAKIKNWFKDNFMYPKDDDLEEEMDEDEIDEEEIDGEGTKKGIANLFAKLFNRKDKEEKDTKTEKDSSKEADKKEEKKDNEHQAFMKRLKNMDEYEIFDVADKGIDGIKEEKIAKARKTLMENKLKSAEESKLKYETKYNQYHKPEPGKEKVDRTTYVDEATLKKLDDKAR